MHARTRRGTGAAPSQFPEPEGLTTGWPQEGHIENGYRVGISFPQKAHLMMHDYPQGG